MILSKQTKIREARERGEASRNERHNSHKPRCVPQWFFSSRGSSRVPISIHRPVSIQIDARQSGLADDTLADLGLVGLGLTIDHDQMIDRSSIIMSFLLTPGIYTHVVICELCL
jgi:hypothetical protein